MAIAFVQVKLIEASSGTSANATMGSTPTAGNLMAVVFGQFAGTVTNAAVTDNKGNPTYSRVNTVANGASFNASTHYAKNILSGATFTVTCNGGASTNGVTAMALEFSGCDATTPFTAGEQNTGSGTSASTTPAVTGAATNTTNANSVYVGIYINGEASNGSGVQTITGWTTPAGGNENNGATFLVGKSGYLIVASSSSRTMSTAFTINAGTSDFAEAFAIYQQSTGGGGGVTVKPLAALGVG
jgi:hypothetical protein